MYNQYPPILMAVTTLDRLQLCAIIWKGWDYGLLSPENEPHLSNKKKNLMRSMLIDLKNGTVKTIESLHGLLILTFHLSICILGALNLQKKLGIFLLHGIALLPFFINIPLWPPCLNFDKNQVSPLMNFIPKCNNYGICLRVQSQNSKLNNKFFLLIIIKSDLFNFSWLFKMTLKILDLHFCDDILFQP